MHSRTYYYTADDLEYADNKNQISVTFHYNSDLSGEVTIESEVAVMRVPGSMLLDFVGEYMGKEIISMVEDMNGRDLLRYMASINGR